MQSAEENPHVVEEYLEAELTHGVQKCTAGSIPRYQKSALEPFQGDPQAKEVEAGSRSVTPRRKERQQWDRSELLFIAVRAHQ